MTEGIFNPYEKPKPAFQSPLDNDNPLDTELPGRVVPQIKLNSGNYTIILELDNLEEIPKKLEEITLKLQDKAPQHVLTNGVRFIAAGETYQPDAGETTLATPNGHLCIYVGKADQSEIEDKAFTRLGYMLHTLNNPQLLQTMGVSITTRG